MDEHIKLRINNKFIPIYDFPSLLHYDWFQPAKSIIIDHVNNEGLIFTRNKNNTLKEIGQIIVPKTGSIFGSWNKYPEFTLKPFYYTEDEIEYDWDEIINYFSENYYNFKGIKNKKTLYDLIIELIDINPK